MAGLTEKQKKLVNLAAENYGIDGETLSKGELLLKAGYSEHTSKSPSVVFESKKVQRAIADVAEEMNLVRDSMLEELKARDLSEEQMKDIVRAIDVLTRNGQLLSGGVTSRTQSAVLLHELTDEELHDYTRRGNSGTSEERAFTETS